MSEASPIHLFLTYYCNQKSERWHNDRLREYDSPGIKAIIPQVQGVFRMGLPNDKQILGALRYPRESLLEQDLNRYIQTGERSSNLEAAFHASVMPDLAPLTSLMRERGSTLLMERAQDPFHHEDTYDMMFETGLLCQDLNMIHYALDNGERSRLDRLYVIDDLLKNIPAELAVIASPDDAYLGTLLGNRRHVSITFPDPAYPTSFSTMLRKEYSETGQVIQELLMRSAIELRFCQWLNTEGFDFTTSDRVAMYYAAKLDLGMITTLLEASPRTPHMYQLLLDSIRWVVAKSNLPTPHELSATLKQHAQPTRTLIQ